MKKLFPFSSPFRYLGLPVPDKRNLKPGEGKNLPVNAGPDKTGAEAFYVTRFMACSFDGGVYEQRLKIFPDKRKAFVAGVRKVRRSEMRDVVRQKESTASLSTVDARLYNSGVDEFDVCPYCGADGELRCWECGTESCTGYAVKYGGYWKCPVCRAGSHIKKAGFIRLKILSPIMSLISGGGPGPNKTAPVLGYLEAPVDTPETFVQLDPLQDSKLLNDGNRPLVNPANRKKARRQEF